MKTGTFHWMQTFVAVAGLLLLAVMPGHGQTSTTWSGVDGDWDTAANWSNGLPDATGAFFDANLASTGTNYTVTYDSAAGFAPFKTLVMGSGATLEVNADGAPGGTGLSFSGALTLNSGSEIDVNDGGIFTEAKTGVAQLNAGSVFNIHNGGKAWLGNGGANPAGQLNIDAGGQLTTWGGGNFTLTTVASTNAGTWSNAASGGIVISGGGTLTNTGALSSAVSNNTTLTVGNDSNGILNMNGGTLTSAFTPTGTVTATTWLIGVNVGAVFSGTGTGTFNMTGGTATNTGALLVGTSKQNTRARTGTGNFNMSGGSWTNSSANSFVIFGGNTTTSASNMTAGVTDNVNSLTGNATISGTAAFSAAGTTIFGGGGGVGVLNMQGGTFTVGNGGTSTSLVLGASGTSYGALVTSVGTGTMNLSGGTVTADNLQANSGVNSVINFTGGTLNVNSASVNLADGNGAKALTVGDGTQAARLNLASTAGTYAFSSGLIISANGVLQTSAGAVTLTGTNVTNGGTLAIGGMGAIGQLTLGGSTALALGATSQLTFELGGTGQGTQYDFLSIGGAATLGGILDIEFINGFQNTITSADTFTILADAAGLASAFSNVADGGTLSTAYGTFKVDYAGNSVILSDFQADVVPEPGTLPLAGVGLGVFGAGMWLARRRAADGTPAVR